MSRSFRRLVWSNLAAQTAEQIALAAAPILAVVALGGGAGETGLIQTAQTLPFLLFAIPAGLLADRLSRRRLMMYAEAVRTGALLVILLLVWLDALTWPLLGLLGLVGACGTVAFSVSAPSMVPALVPASTLPAANSRIELARTVAFAAGPSIGGLLVAWAGGAPAFILAALLSAAAVLLLSGVAEPHRAPPAKRHPLDEIRDGARFVFRHPLLRPIFATTFVFNSAFFLLMAVFVPYAIRSLGLSSAGVGLALGACGFGMIAGALAARPIIANVFFGKVVAIGPLSGLAASCLMLCTVAYPAPWLAMSSFWLFGFGPVIWVVSTTTLRQTVTPPNLLGRVSSINIMAQGARPIGAALGALIAVRYGTETCLLVATLGFLIQAIIILSSPVMRFPTIASMVPAAQSS